MLTERTRAIREGRRRTQFQKFHLVQLNLIPLVDTFVAIVFFSLTAATVGDLAPILTGVTLPQAKVGAPAHQELTLGVSSRPAAIVFNGRQLMSVDRSCIRCSRRRPIRFARQTARVRTSP